MKLPKVVDEIISAASKDTAIIEIYVFGSYARGEATIFSDLDIAVIHTGEVNRGKLNKVAAQYDEDVQFTYVEEEVFSSDDHPLHVTSSIKREGVLLWQR